MGRKNRRKGRPSKPKKRKREQATKKQAKDGPPGGLDYGCLPRVMAIASPDFLDCLNLASVNAIVYGEEYSQELKMRIPSISLAAQNGEALARAFEIFHGWAESSDHDAVDVVITFEESGGYTLALGPEFDRLTKRCVGNVFTEDVMTSTFYWMKTFETASPQLLAIRDYCSRAIAPVSLGGLTYSASNDAIKAGADPRFRQPQGLESLLKFNITFADATEAGPGSFARSFSRLKSGVNETASTATDPSKGPAEIARRRVGVLRRAFPVTLERIHRSQWYRELVAQFAGDGVRAWQVEQAICNLLLSRDVGRGDHYGGATHSEVESIAVEGIRGRTERADGQALESCDPAIVLNQIVADMTSLLRHLGERSASKLSLAIRRLGAEHLDAGREARIARSPS